MFENDCWLRFFIVRGASRQVAGVGGTRRECSLSATDKLYTDTLLHTETHYNTRTHYSALIQNHQTHQTALILTPSPGNQQFALNYISITPQLLHLSIQTVNNSNSVTSLRTSKESKLGEIVLREEERCNNSESQSWVFQSSWRGWRGLGLLVLPERKHLAKQRKYVKPSR